MRFSPFAALLGLLFGITNLNADSPPVPTKYWAFIGTYTGKMSKGIYRIEFDTATGKLGKAEVAAEIGSPSFLAVHPKLTHLFCVCEEGIKGQKGGGVGSFTLDPKTGELKAVNVGSSVGDGPCHIVVDKEAKNVLLANYGGGSVAVLPLGEGGKLGEATSFVQHKGSSTVKSRQSEPHAHSINLDKANKFAIVADLGLDKVLVYKFDAAHGKIALNDPAGVALESGDGPRHFAFHPSKPFAYVNNELSSSVTALTYDAEHGTFKKLNSLSTLPEPTKGNSTAETVVHPSGKFVYVSNRGHNSIAMFAVNQDTGELKALGHQGEGIKVPRNFNIDPSGQWMLVANQDGHSVIVFKIDPETGKLSPTDQKAEVGSPVCIKFVPKL
ncbi:lactonase family protein [Zavarzinella formosa]|uniref:lactonase family protein n=1 Tax=Zavarzinella formosa TaxID=360055 RepID=UPI0002ED2AE9|nr:lactonase family protein [Zavarzinella formosa]